MNVTGDFFNATKDLLFEVLPTSPFADVIDSISALPYLGYLNWFFPFGTCVKIFGLWLTAYGLYLGYVIVMRWIKVAGE